MRLTALTATVTLAATAALVAASGSTARASDGPPPILNGAALELALEKLTVVGSALFIAAHPDDENTAMLTWLENEKLVRAGYLSLTRGDGGQNLIGNEQGDLLGVIRTQELLAARRIDGAEQFFTRAIDFGYSKTPDETLDKWGREEMLSDVVRVIRSFQPDVIVMRFPTTGEGRHGHHTASAFLAVDAFEAAADPARFTDQLATLAPWKAKRLYWNYFSWAAPPSGDSAKAFLPIDLGAYNPLLGRSYTELAGESRSMHKSQGFGSAERRGSSTNYFKLIAGEPAAKDPFEGIDLTWRRIPGGKAVGDLLTEAHRRHDPVHPTATLPRLLAARKALTRLAATPDARSYAALLAYKTQELDGVIRSCAGLWVEAIAKTPAVSPGDSIQVDVTVLNRSNASLRLSGIESPVAGLEATADTVLMDNQPVTLTRRTTIPDDLDWRTTQPYWLRETHTGGLHSVGDPALIGTPENSPALHVAVKVETGGQTLTYQLPVLYRWVDRVRGELYRPVAIVPVISVSLDEKVYLFPDATPKTVAVRLEARKPARGTARLVLPSGWHAEPEAIDVELAVGQTRDVPFRVTPGVQGSPVRAEFTAQGTAYSRGTVVIDHEHIPIQTLFPEASAHVIRLDLERRGDRVGYVMGPGDDVPAALAQAGYQVTLLDDEYLASGNLSEYGSIVVGVRAYNSRDALKQNAGRLLDYVNEGGTLVVQYNTSDATLYEAFAPLPLKLGRDRVTVEEAPIEFTDAASPLLNEPNKITQHDFEGWIQERGLYFASEWDPKYQTVLSSADPGEKAAPGGLLWARHGKGVFIYTGYAFFRQLPAGVPGAYRLFVNLVSAR